MPGFLTWLDISLAALGLVFISRLIGKRSSGPLPPGPKKLPILGNVLDMPSEKEWFTFAKWGETWGDIVSVTIFGQPLIILNSANKAAEMLDKKSLIYSDRPVMQMGGELVGWKRTLVLVPYGDRFRNYRKLFYKLIGSHSAMKKFHPVEELETRRFLRRVLNKPEDLAVHVRKTAGAIILRISHGYKVKEEKDPFVTLAEVATEQFSLSTAPGVFLVNLIPALTHIPEWFPGAGFKKTAREWAATLLEMTEQPHNFVKQQMASGTAEVSFTSALLDEKDVSADEEEDIKWSASSLYSGGADTTVSANYAFFLAMALHPEIQRKAQAEIDAIIGNDRFPGFADRHRLPYVNAVALELLRWHAVIPTGVPHRCMEDNIHDGYFIPKGSLVITNIWNMLHDPRTYTRPMDFEPTRFLASEGKTPETDPRDICFGFGRRICPGKVLADASIFILCAMTLAVFDISKCVENGVVIEPAVGQTTGTISHPIPFKCSIRPRSERAIALIQAD